MSINSNIAASTIEHHSLLVFADSDIQRAGCGINRIQVPSLPSRWKSESGIKNMIWHENAYNFVSSLEDGFAMTFMSNVKFYMPVSQPCNLDLLHCTVHAVKSKLHGCEDKKMTSEASEGRLTDPVH